MLAAVQTAVQTATGRRLTRLQRIARAGQLASGVPVPVQGKVFNAIMRGRSRGISSRDIKSFNRVIGLVARVERYIGHHPIHRNVHKGRR